MYLKLNLGPSANHKKAKPLEILWQNPTCRHEYFCKKFKNRDPPFKTLAFLGGEGSKIGPICQRIVVKKLLIEGGRGQKS